MSMFKKRRWLGLAVIAAVVPVPEAASRAQDDVGWVSTYRGRYEFAVGVHSWPGLADLDAARDGQFDAVGFNISFAAHWPVMRFAGSELLAGLDLGLFANDSDIRFISESITARNGYLVPSVKWISARCGTRAGCHRHWARMPDDCPARSMSTRSVIAGASRRSRPDLRYHPRASLMEEPFWV